MQETAVTSGFGDVSKGITVSLLVAAALIALLIAVLIPGWATTVAFCSLAVTFSFCRVNAFLYAVIFFLPLSPVVATGFPLHNISTFVQRATFVGFALRQLFSGTPARKWLFAARLNRLANIFILQGKRLSVRSYFLFAIVPSRCHRVPASQHFYVCAGFHVRWLRSPAAVQRNAGPQVALCCTLEPSGYYFRGDRSSLHFCFQPRFHFLVACL